MRYVPESILHAAGVGHRRRVANECYGDFAPPERTAYRMERILDLGTPAPELIVQDDTEKGAMHLQSAVVVNEAKLSELVHEEIHP